MKEQALLFGAIFACACEASEPAQLTAKRGGDHADVGLQAQALLREGTLVTLQTAVTTCAGRTAVAVEPNAMDEAGPWRCVGDGAVFTTAPDSLADLRARVSKVIMEKTAGLCPAGKRLLYRATDYLGPQLPGGELQLLQIADYPPEDRSEYAEEVKLIEDLRYVCDPRPSVHPGELPAARLERLKKCAIDHVKYDDVANFTNLLSMTSDPEAMFSGPRSAIAQSTLDANYMMVFCLDPVSLIDVNEVVPPDKNKTFSQHELQYSLAPPELVDRDTLTKTNTTGVRPMRTYLLPTLTPPCGEREWTHSAVEAIDPGLSLELPWKKVEKGFRIVAASSSANVPAARLFLQYKETAEGEVQTVHQIEAARALDYPLTGNRKTGFYRVAVTNLDTAARTLRGRMDVLRGNCGGLPDLCYGGIGAQCEFRSIIPQGSLLDLAPSCRAEPNGTLRCATAVGSEAHDSCCAMSVFRRDDGSFLRRGKWCAGPGSAWDNTSCGAEWSHAVGDTLTGRRWEEPYDPIAFGYTGTIALARQVTIDEFAPTEYSMLAPNGTRLWIRDAARLWCKSIEFHRLNPNEAMCGPKDTQEPCIQKGATCEPPEPPSPSPTTPSPGADPRSQGNCTSPRQAFCGSDGKQYVCSEGGAWLSSSCRTGEVCEGGECRCPAGQYATEGTCAGCPAPLAPSCAPGTKMSSEGNCVAQQACIDVKGTYAANSSYQVINWGWEPYVDYHREEVLPGEWSELPVIVSEAESAACCQSSWLTNLYAFYCTRKMEGSGATPVPFAIPGFVAGSGADGWPQLLSYAGGLPGKYFEDQIGAECTAFAGRSFELKVTAEGPVRWCGGEKTRAAECPANTFICGAKCVASPACCQ